MVDVVVVDKISELVVILQAFIFAHVQPLFLQ